MSETTKPKSTAKNRPRILLAEDDKEMRSLLARALRRAGYEISECPDGIALLDYLFHLLPAKNENIDLIISDIWMGGVTGLEVLEGLHDRDEFPPMILITAFGDQETHAKARRLGAVAMFDKPFDTDDLLAVVREFVPPGTSGA